VAADVTVPSASTFTGMSAVTAVASVTVVGAPRRPPPSVPGGPPPGPGPDIADASAAGGDGRFTSHQANAPISASVTNAITLPSRRRGRRAGWAGAASAAR
jgi:hypothetical protein